MKVIGFIFILVGGVVLFYIVNTYLLGPEKDISPILENDGVKVIYETPTP